MCATRAMCYCYARPGGRMWSNLRNMELPSSFFEAEVKGGYNGGTCLISATNPIKSYFRLTRFQKSIAICPGTQSCSSEAVNSSKRLAGPWSLVPRVSGNVGRFRCSFKWIQICKSLLEETHYLCCCFMRCVSADDDYIFLTCGQNSGPHATDNSWLATHPFVLLLKFGPILGRKSAAFHEYGYQFSWIVIACHGLAGAPDLWLEFAGGTLKKPRLMWLKGTLMWNHLIFDEKSTGCLDMLLNQSSENCSSHSMVKIDPLSVL